VAEYELTDASAVPVIILSASRDPVESINGILRRAGQPSHCTWIPALPDLADALPQINPELLLVVSNDAQMTVDAAKVREMVAPEVPLLAIGDEFSESAAAALMRIGARDLVSLQQPGRLEAVMLRELRTFRLERALNTTLQNARDYRKQLETVLASSNDAIAQIQEGIIVEANESWLELFGYVDTGVLVGQPLMDFFESVSHAALKGALASALQGRWQDRSLNAVAHLADGSHLAIDVNLAPGQFDGEQSVRLIVPARKKSADGKDLAVELADAVRRDSATGLLQRRPLIDSIRERLSVPAPGGLRALACVRIDRFAALEKSIGVEASEHVLSEFAKVFQSHLSSHDLAGRFSGPSFLVLLERGNESDLDAWARQLTERVAKTTINTGHRPISISCSVGLSNIPHTQPDVDAAIFDSVEAVRKARQRGTGQVLHLDRSDADSRVLAYDAIWVKHIKAALLENRFKLVQQPVASLQGDDPQMFDVMVRMLDHSGKEVLPSDFMPAAERNDLLKNIDRWVIGAALNFAAQKNPACLFVRLSRDTVIDQTLPAWLDLQLRSTKVQPARICFQVIEKVAAEQEAQVATLAKALKQRGFRFALERFGSADGSSGLATRLPLDFIKIDGAMVQGLSGNFELQQKVKLLVGAATNRKILTIAERVEDANTMAVLWQLGVQFIQGYFIHEPAEVVMDAERA
jgi:diguanylate cyclase (GGDEF)-like protein/PAS domain S-box-containing protein